MPEESHAAEEHALMAEITEPLSNLPAEPPPISPEPDFPIVLRGYDRVAVDAYIRHTSELIAELHSRHSPDAAVRRALGRVGEEVTGILQRAHETAGELTSGSRREAEERLESSRREAEERLETARREAEERLSSSRQEAQDTIATAMAEAQDERARAHREAEQIVADARDRLVELDADADRVWAERERIVEDVRGLSSELQGLASAAAERFPPAATGEAPAVSAGEDATIAIDPVEPPADSMEAFAAEDPDATAPLRPPEPEA